MKKPSIDVIYLPGLGDWRSHGQEAVLKLWRAYGLTVHYHKLGWGDKESFEPKKQRILDKIDSLTKDGGQIALIGTSAGASASINAFAERRDKVSSVVCLCGKLKNPDTVSEGRYERNPAFKDSMKQLPNSLARLSLADRSRIMSVHPLHDGTVPIQDTIVKGIVEEKIPTIGHSFSIGFSLTFGSASIADFIREKST